MSNYEIAFPVNPADKKELESPNREILTPEGVRKLLNVKESAYKQMLDNGLPAVKTSNSYRHVRHQVIKWMEIEAERHAINRLKATHIPEEEEHPEGEQPQE